MKEILDFNKKQENRDLQNYYSSKSFMEACGVGRDEKAHSAFLAWIIKDTDEFFKANDTPLMWLLQAIISRCGTSNVTIPQNFVAQVLSRKLRYNNLQVETEYPVKMVNSAYFGQWSGIDPSDDKMDIYITCGLHNCPGLDSLEIVIENKVMSPEEGPKSRVRRIGYDDQYQTAKYYNVVTSTSGSNKLQLFVYLKPGQVGASTEATCKQFIQINYQDILDYILIPMLGNEDISNKIRWRVQDYIEGLSLPTLDPKEKKRIIMARTQEESIRLAHFIEDNCTLLFNALVAKTKKDKGVVLSNDELALLELIDSNKELFYAVADFTNGDCDVVSDTPIAGSFFINEELKVYNNMNFGLRFLELFYEENKKNLSQGTPYADQLNTMLTAFFSSKTSWYGDKAKDPAHFRVIDEKNNLSAMFCNFGTGQNLDKLLNGLHESQLPWFVWQQISDFCQ